jgi:hypothetical protein
LPDTSPPWRPARARVIVVPPAYNEEKSLGLLLQRLDQSMHEDDLEYDPGATILARRGAP